MTEVPSEIRLCEERSRVELPDGTVYEARYVPLEPDDDTLAAMEQELARQAEDEQQILQRLREAGTQRRVELVGMGFADGTVRSVTLIKLDEEVDESMIAAALPGITVRCRTT